MALCTQLDVEQKLQWDITADPDTTVTALIADAQALIEAEVGRTLESAAREEVFDGGRVSLFLKWWPVTAITTIDEDSTLLAATDYKFYEYGKLIRVANDNQVVWKTRKRQAIEVDYIGGYLAGHSDEHDMALEHLGSICSAVVARAFIIGAKNAALPIGASGAVQSVSLTGSDTVTYATSGGGDATVVGGLSQFVSLLEDERRQLQRYRGISRGIA